MQVLCSWENAVGKISRKKHGVAQEEAWCSEVFHFLSPLCDLLPCVVLVFPTCKVFSSLGLAVSTFLLYLLTENFSGAKIVRFERAEDDLGVE